MCVDYTYIRRLKLNMYICVKSGIKVFRRKTIIIIFFKLNQSVTMTTTFVADAFYSIMNIHTHKHAHYNLSKVIGA